MRLIDADKLPKWTGYALSATEIAIEVERAPTVDAEPVVRCRDCIWSRRGVSGDLFCFYTGLVKEYYFCSYGERNNGNKKDECLGCYWSGYDGENAVIRKPCDDCPEINLRKEANNVQITD